MTIKLSDSVVARPVGDELVLLDLEGGTYFGLDPIGARLWALFEEGHDTSDVINCMLNEYDVDRDTLEKDVTELIKQLCELKLVTVEPSGQSP